MIRDSDMEQILTKLSNPNAEGWVIMGLVNGGKSIETAVINLKDGEVMNTFASWLYSKDLLDKFTEGVDAIKKMRDFIS